MYLYIYISIYIYIYINIKCTYRQELDSRRVVSSQVVGLKSLRGDLRPVDAPTLDSGSRDHTLVGPLWEGTTRAEDAQRAPTHSHISPSIPAYEEKTRVCSQVFFRSIRKWLRVQVHPDAALLPSASVLRAWSFVSRHLTLLPAHCRDVKHS